MYSHLALLQPPLPPLLYFALLLLSWDWKPRQIKQTLSGVYPNIGLILSTDISRRAFMCCPGLSKHSNIKGTLEYAQRPCCLFNNSRTNSSEMMQVRWSFGSRIVALIFFACDFELATSRFTMERTDDLCLLLLHFLHCVFLCISFFCLNWPHGPWHLYK